MQEPDRYCLGVPGGGVDEKRGGQIPMTVHSSRGGSRIFERGALFWKSIGAGSKGATGHVPPRFFEEGAQGGTML